MRRGRLCVRPSASDGITGAPFAGVGDAPPGRTRRRRSTGSPRPARSTRRQRRSCERPRARVDRFKPAYDALIAWVDSDVANSDEIATGVGKLPDGPAFYEERLWAETTTDMTAEQIHALGLREVERIKGEMDAIRRQVGFDGTLSQFFEFVRSDARFTPNTDEGREAYLAEARRHPAIKERLPEFFGLLPKLFSS